MKKTRFEKFMLAVTKKALKEERLDTYSDHLKFVRLSIEFELLKFGGSEGIAAEEPPKETSKGRSKVEQISGVLGTTKRTAIRIGNGLKKIYSFLITGHNIVIVLIGSLFLYAVIMVALEMI